MEHGRTRISSAHWSQMLLASNKTGVTTLHLTCGDNSMRRFQLTRLRSGESKSDV